MLGNPRLGVRFGFEHADRGRMTVRDADLDPECPIVKRDYTIGRFGVGMYFGHFPRPSIMNVAADDPERGHPRK